MNENQAKKRIKKEDDKDELYPNNSHAASVMSVPINKPKPGPTRATAVVPVEASKRVRKVVKGSVVKRKKGFAQFLAKAFMGDDSRNVGSFILYDVLIPAAKSTISEVITSGIEMVLYGETRRRNRDRDRDRGRSVIDYRSYYRGDRYDNDRDRDHEYRRRERTFDFEDIIFKHGDDAAEVLEQLIDALEEYKQVTVADFFDLAGIETNYTHQKWGWTNLSKAYCATVRGGYIVVLPRPVELD